MDNCRKIDFRYGFYIFIVSFVFYLFTLAPTILWGDSAKLALYVHNLYLPFDLAGGHPLHTLFGKLFSYIPARDLAYTQNLMSAFFGSATLLIMFLVMRRIKIGFLSSLIATVSLAVSHTFWLVSVINESYTLSLFFIAALLFFAVLFIDAHDKKPIIACLFSFIFGLSLTNSLMVLFLAPGILYIVLSSRPHGLRLGHLFMITVSFIAGSSLLVFLYFKNSSGAALSIPFNSLATQAKSFISPHSFLKENLKYFAYLFYQFPSIVFIAGILGVGQFFNKNKKLFFATVIFLICYIFFTSSYMLQRKFFILSPTYVIFSLYAGFGLDSIIKNKNRFFVTCILITTVIMPIAIYKITPSLLEAKGVRPVAIRKLPHRDNLSFYFWPGKRNEYGARKYGEEALSSAGPGSIIITDFTIGRVLEYLQDIEGKRPDVRIEGLDKYLWRDKPWEKIESFIGKNISEHPVYLADNQPYYYIKYLQERYIIENEGVLYKLSARHPNNFTN